MEAEIRRSSSGHRHGRRSHLGEDIMSNLAVPDCQHLWNEVCTRLKDIIPDSWSVIAGIRNPALTGMRTTWRLVDINPTARH